MEREVEMMYGILVDGAREFWKNVSVVARLEGSMKRISDELNLVKIDLNPMQSIETLRKTLEASQERFDNEITPAIEKADKAVQKYGFSSYMDLMAAMMQLSKSIVATCKKIKELSTIEDEIEAMDDLLEIYEPIVNEMLPTVQNALVENLPSETFDEMDENKSLEGLVKFITTWKNVQSLEDYIRNEVYKLYSDEKIKQIFIQK